MSVQILQNLTDSLNYFRESVTEHLFYLILQTL